MPTDPKIARETQHVATRFEKDNTVAYQGETLDMARVAGTARARLTMDGGYDAANWAIMNGADSMKKLAAAKGDLDQLSWADLLDVSNVLREAPLLKQAADELRHTPNEDFLKALQGSDAYGAAYLRERAQQHHSIGDELATHVEHLYHAADTLEHAIGHERFDALEKGRWHYPPQQSSLLPEAHPLAHLREDVKAAGLIASNAQPASHESVPAPTQKAPAEPGKPASKAVLS